jgi:hypothetical protein
MGQDQQGQKPCAPYSQCALANRSAGDDQDVQCRSSLQISSRSALPFWFPLSMGARSECPDACYICPHGISTKAFEAVQHEQHGVFTAIDEGSVVGHGIANVSITRDGRAVGSNRANVCSECRKSTMVKSPARIQSTSLTRCRRRCVCPYPGKPTAKIGKPIGQNRRHGFNVFDEFAWGHGPALGYGIERFCFMHTCTHGQRSPGNLCVHMQVERRPHEARVRDCKY